jgi:hypothetical protein
MVADKIPAWPLVDEKIRLFDWPVPNQYMCSNWGLRQMLYPLPN